MLPSIDTARELLDKGYLKQARRLLEAISSAYQPNSLLRRRIAELYAEADRLEKIGERLRPDNPVIRRLLGDLKQELNNQRVALSTAALQTQIDALKVAERLSKALTLPEGSSLGVAWNRADPEAVAKLVDYVNQPAFRSLINNYPADVINRIQRGILSGFVQGKSPRALAALIRKYATTMPAYIANGIARTTQLQSWRDATMINYQANANILQYAIRIETLDKRCCVACLALHGTRMEIGARLKGHWNCRGTAIGVTRVMPRSVQTGEQWLRLQSAAVQKELMGEAAWNAWQRGVVRLSDFVEDVNDPIFGEMIREASLKGILGASARMFYKK